MGRPEGPWKGTLRPFKGLAFPLPFARSSCSHSAAPGGTMPDRLQDAGCEAKGHYPPCLLRIGGPNATVRNPPPAYRPLGRGSAAPGSRPAFVWRGVPTHTLPPCGPGWGRDSWSLCHCGQCVPACSLLLDCSPVVVHHRHNAPRLPESSHSLCPAALFTLCFSSCCLK